MCFITFNYDCSLEEYFFDVLQSTWDQNAAKDFFNAIPIFHIHGKLKSLPWDFDGNFENGIPLNRSATGSTQIRRMAEGIKLVHENENYENKNEVMTYISKTKKIIYLGFGFHTNNLLKLGTSNSSDFLSRHRSYSTGHGIQKARRSVIREQMGFSTDESFGLTFSETGCVDLLHQIEDKIK